VIDRQVRATILLAEATALGLDLSDLVAAHGVATRPLPTLGEWIDAITPAFTPRTAATYQSYWNLAVTRLGEHRLAEITVVDLQAVVNEAVARAQSRRPGSTGRASQESCIAALRAVFGRAANARLVPTNPAAALRKPHRGRSRRRALDDTELAELIDAIRTTSDDPDLDLLLVRFHLETGARRQGGLNLRLRDIDTRRSTVWLREKNNTEREQPTSPSLIAQVQRHATTRAANHPDDPVFRRSNGTPITARRYDRMFTHARVCLPWSDHTAVSAHVLRHTAINAVGRLAGYPVAQTFAGHRPPTVTGLYMQATIHEVARTIATLTGEPHPLTDTT
jgi:integrase